VTTRTTTRTSTRTTTRDHRLDDAAVVPGEDLTALDALLDDVATTALDHPAWEVLRRRAGAVTRSLAARGLTPAATVVAAGDPPVVVARALARAADHTRAAVRDAALARRGPVAC
jgi:hypothetical protein